MIDMSWLINSVWTKRVLRAEYFVSTGRATGGQGFVKLHLDPSPVAFPNLVMGDLSLDYAWIQLGHPCYLTEDGTAWRPRPERPPLTETKWLEGLFVDFRLELKEFRTRWQGEKIYLAPRFLKINQDFAS